MTTGSIQTVVVCVAAAKAPNTICPAGMVMTTTQAYVLDVSQQASFVASVAPFDYVQAASIWTFAFTFVVGLFLVSKSSGTILQMIRR